MKLGLPPGSANADATRAPEAAMPSSSIQVVSRCRFQ